MCISRDNLLCISCVNLFCISYDNLFCISCNIFYVFRVIICCVFRVIFVSCCSWVFSTEIIFDVNSLETTTKVDCVECSFDLLVKKNSISLVFKPNLKRLSVTVLGIE